MTTPSCSVISDQSPWRQTFGYFSKYAARYLAPSGSFQNPIGIDGKGLVQTSSPFSPCTGLPCSSNTSIAMPRPLAWISPRHTGAVGLPSTKQDTMSVPPEMDDRQTSFLMLV